eukprot:scaffold137014_cov31-Tisochrysis_lutea.AAC.8
MGADGKRGGDFKEFRVLEGTHVCVCLRRISTRQDVRASALSPEGCRDGIGLVAVEVLPTLRLRCFISIILCRVRYLTSALAPATAGPWHRSCKTISTKNKPSHGANKSSPCAQTRRDATLRPPITWHTHDCTLTIRRCPIRRCPCSCCGVDY